MKNFRTLCSVLGTIALAACSSTVLPPQSAAAVTADDQTDRADDDSSASTSEPDVAVKASFETSVAAVTPGTSFLVAAHFNITDGYRLPWLNPGDMGKEMAIEFRAPEGFDVSSPMFPGPTRYDLPDGFVSYGYDSETAIFAEIRVPTTVVPNEVYRFELSAKWLACKGSCLNEGIDAYFELVGSQSVEEQGFTGALPRFFESIPEPIGELGGTSLEWRAPGTLAIRASGVTWKDFFPNKGAPPTLSQMSLSTDQSELVLHFSNPIPGAAVQGVLLAEVNGQQRYLAINETPPEAE